jgi:hypothetical protein
MNEIDEANAKVFYWAFKGLTKDTKEAFFLELAKNEPNELNHLMEQFEDLCLLNAIKEGEKGEFVSIEEVFKSLDT